MNNPFESAMEQLARATAVKNFKEEFINLVKQPQREVKVSIPVRMDNGSLKVFEGYRVQYNNFRGPCKGGIRYHETTDINEVRALSFWMALKCALMNIPMGGGKGGVTVDPRKLSKKELERLSRGWMWALYEVLGPRKDVPAPDLNTNSEIMDWMADEYAKLTGDKTGAVITGKSIDKGGSEGRTSATGRGGFYVFDTLREKLNLPPVCRVVIQGFGNVGLYAAKFWQEAGHKIVAISDFKGGIYKEDGIDWQELSQHVKTTGSVVDFYGSRPMTNAELLQMDCDVLIPAALENQITSENAEHISAKVVFELANGPTTPEAEDILFSRGVPVVPDILANAGGVIVSTFEWEQNLEGEHWTETEVAEKLKKIMERETMNVWKHSKDLKTDLRRAAYIIALERIEKATPV